MGVTIVQSGYGGITGEVTLGVAPTPGNTLVMLVARRDAGEPADPFFGGFTTIAKASHTAGFDRSCGIWYRVVTADETGVTEAGDGVTYQAGAAGDRMLLVELAGEYAGAFAERNEVGATTAIDAGGLVVVPEEGYDDGIVLGVAAIGDGSVTGVPVTEAAGVTAWVDEMTNANSPYVWMAYRQLTDPEGSVGISGTIGDPFAFCGVSALFVSGGRPVVSPLPPLPEYVPAPPDALIEIYTADADAYRWGAADADWSDGDPVYLSTWGGGGWQDVTPLAVECIIRWGTTDLDPGILSDQAAADWSVTFYDPERVLDPGNASSPYAPDLVPGLPIRLSHRGIVVRTGRAERISYRHAFGTAAIRASDAIAQLARAEVPEDAVLSDFMKLRAIEVVAASGAPVTVQPGSGDYAVPEYPAAAHDAWWWIRNTSRDRHVIPYVDPHDQIRFRAYSVPLRRGATVTDANIVELETSIAEGNRVSKVRVTDETGSPVYEIAETPAPVYGLRVHERDLPTTDAEAWAAQVIDDRVQAAIRYRPGEIRAWSADDVAALAYLEPNEEITLDVAGVVTQQANVLGGRIRVAWETQVEGAAAAPTWRFWLNLASGQSIVLVSDQSGDPLVSDDDDETYLEVDG